MRVSLGTPFDPLVRNGNVVIVFPFGHVLMCKSRVVGVGIGALHGTVVR